MHNETYTLRERQPLALGDEIDHASLGVKLKGPAKWRDGSPKTLVAVKVLVCGSWAGHAAGKFEVTRKTLSEIVANFNKRGIAIPWDHGHASEADETSGSLPLNGAPACGWIHALRISADGESLLAITEWLDDAREGILAGKFAYCSPALRLGSVDGKSGDPSGARLTSCAIVGQPFLAELPDLVAASDRSSVATDIQLRDAAAQVITLTARLADESSRRVAAEELVGGLHARATQAEGALLTAQKTVDDMNAAEAERVVQDRHLTYHSKKPMRIEAMRALYFASRASFDNEFPEVSPERQYLLRDLVPPEKRPTEEPPKGNKYRGLSVIDTTLAIMADEHLSYSEAHMKALSILGAAE